MTTETKPDLIESINDTKTSGFHYKTWLVSGLGFFTDAYDLFIIGVVTSILVLSGWSKFTTLQSSLLDSTALLSAVIGAMIFGRLLDKLGRKAVYGIELIILVIGALGSAFLTPTNGVNILIIWRFILGIGIGGDYATSSTIMAEYSNTAHRGKLVGMVFSMQSLGLLAGPLVSLGLIYSGMSLTLVWKLLLAFGAIPALIVVYYRRKMPETPRYLLRVRGDAQGAAKNWQKYTGIAASADAETETVKESWTQILKQRKFILTLLGTAGTWFLMDWALYGNSIMSSSMLGVLVPASVTGLHHLIRTTEYSAMVFGFAALPGYWPCNVHHRQDWKEDHTVHRICRNGSFLRNTWHIPPAAFSFIYCGVPDSVRPELLLHRIRAKCDNLHISTRSVPNQGEGLRCRSFGCRRKDRGFHWNLPECHNTGIINR
ncbi:MAG: hypothetical protein AMDU1_APLC00013G0068 [Thermoplasmatales archaeon A-plasma]|nr:MAG: hypothetical protein AMDU1_APLC00013G0068 [Thermoplasmatales archaeon A-plasma]